MAKHYTQQWYIWDIYITLVSIYDLVQIRGNFELAQEYHLELYVEPGSGVNWPYFVRDNKTLSRK